ncbi:MAG: hypothetical protein AAGA91_15830 [Pseudomonadota bacterium]
MHLVRAAGGSEFGHHGELFEDFDSTAWDALAIELTMLRDAPRQTVPLLTWEGVHFLSETQLQEVRDRLNRLGYTPQIQYVLREQVELETSGALQRIKTGDFSLSLRRIDDQLQGRAFDWVQRDAQHKVEGLRRVFGSDHITLLTYHREETVADLFALLGIDDLSDFKVGRFNNASLTLEAALALEQMGPALDSPRFVVAAKALLESVDRLGGERRVFSQTSVDWIRARYRDSNRAIARDWFGRDDLFPIRDMALCAGPDEALVDEYLGCLQRALSDADA